MSLADHAQVLGFPFARWQCVGAVVACFALTANAEASWQSAELPPIAPTSAAAAASGKKTGPEGSDMASVLGGAAKHRASVTVTSNRLEVHAENSSLNGILREIASKTGMTINGGILDQRVFGSYGPAPASEVITELLQDSGTNMILRMKPSGELGELVLSPRMGGPTPPSPNSFREEETNQAPARYAPPAPATPVLPPPVPLSKYRAVPAATDSRSPVTPDPAGFVSAPTVTPATEPGTTPGPTPPMASSAVPVTGTTDPNATPGNGTGSAIPQSPNGVKTPQQIFEELQRLQQQEQKP